VGKKNTIIEINGRRYDAISGKPLSEASPAAAHGRHAATARPAAKAMPAVTKKPTMSDVVRHPAPKSGRVAAPSSTLMRHAVKKPSAPLKRSMRVNTPADRPVPAITGTNALVPSSQLQARRQQRAQKIKQSKQIRHFSDFTAAPAYTPPPAPAASQPYYPQPPVQSQPATPPTGRERTNAMLAKALENANGHEPVGRLKKSKRSGKGRKAAVAGVMAVLVLGVVGVIGSQNMTNIRLALASAKIGFHADLPDYQPAGYKLDKLSYGDNALAAMFQAGNKSYLLTEKQSSWDSQALLDNFVSGTDPGYKTADVAGRTVYIYSDHNATWVSGGIWYTIQTDGSLSDQQLLNLAGSL
jgi:hypothetical protein